MSRSADPTFAVAAAVGSHSARAWRVLRRVVVALMIPVLLALFQAVLKFASICRESGGVCGCRSLEVRLAIEWIVASGGQRGPRNAGTWWERIFL